MACRNFLPIIGVLGCALVGCQQPGVGAELAQPALGAYAIEPELSPSPVPFPQAATTRYTAHFQPGQSDAWGAFNGPVPVETLVRHALTNNPQIRAARAQAWSLGARVPQAASMPDPQLTAVAFLDSIQTAAGPQEVMMSLSQKLPWFGKLDLRSRVAHHDALAAHAQTAATELKVAERVKRAYFDVYFLQRAVEVIRSLKPRLKHVIQISETRFENSEVGWENVLKARTELSKLNVRLIQLNQAQTQAQARLAAAAHLSQSTRIEAEAKLDGSKVAHTAELLVELAESYQPELAARRRQISRDRTSVALACRDYWPDVTVSLNWYEIGSRGLSPVATGDDAFSLGVGVSLPIHRKRLDAAVREARHKTARSRHEYAATLDQIREEIETLYAQFVEHDQVLKILDSEIVPSAEKTLDLSLEAYGLGDLEFQQLIDSYEELLGQQIERYRRESLRRQAIASLERAVGSAVTTPFGQTD
ncbi:MAG: TolC family protein [Planctomycetota bacterium]|jgi:outer membrane protein TolC